MAIPYVKFMKHAEKVTKAVSTSRPVLKGVHHAEDGSLAVTDAHRLYVAKNAHANTAGEIIDPKTGGAIEGNYPDVTRLLPYTPDAKYTVKLSVKETSDAFAALLKINQIHDRKNVHVKAEVTDEAHILFSANNPIAQAHYKPNASVEGEGDPITFNTQYFAEALALFKDAGVEEVTMRSYGAFRPFTLTAGFDDDLLALILPIRTY
ncbi:hypothetical protein HYI36_20185 [Bacillus sp. Gen3]|nr:hypothetical protein [Bacillus sp. Gen3]